MADPYAVEPDPELPGLPGMPTVRESEDQVLDALVADVYLHALSCVQSFGDFHIAIGLGPFQERLCRRLMIDPAVRELPWKRTHLWAVTDRPDKTWGAAFTSIMDLLEDHSGIPDSNLHAPDLDHPDPASDYERRLQEALAWREKGHDRLDLAVLAVTPDRPAPWPGAPDGDRLYVREPSPNGAQDGVSMTKRLLNATRLIAVAAVGEQSRDALRAAPADPGLPRPVGGVIKWYVDRAACPV